MKSKETVHSIMTREVKFIISIVVFVLAVAAPFWSVKTDVALIKQNHFVHIENINRNIEEMKEEQIRLEDRQLELMEIIANRLPKG